MKPFFFSEAREKLFGTEFLDFAYPIVHDYPTPNGILEYIKKQIHLIQQYPFCEDALIAEIANYEKVAESNIVITSGINGGLDLIAKTFFLQKKILVPTPTFWQLLEAPKRYNAQIATTDALVIDTICDHGALENDVAGIILCSPLNPHSIEIRKNIIIKILKAHQDKIVVIDQSYADIFDCSLTHLINERKNLIFLKGFKTFTIPGARVGYIIAHPERSIALKQRRIPFEVSVSGQSAAIAALRHIDEIRNIWKLVRADVKYLESKLAMLEGKVYESRTNFVYWEHPQAKAIGEKLFQNKIAVLFPGREVIHGDIQGIRITARNKDYCDILLKCLENILQ